MARCSIHGFDNCPYHGTRDRSPVGAFRFCACFARHDGRTSCECACGQCQVYREELKAGPVAVDVVEPARAPVSHPADGCPELCVPRERWLAQLAEIDTAAAASAIAELRDASTDLALLAGVEKAELVYFGELDRLSAQRTVTKGRSGRKKKSERGKVPLKCALCDVTHPRSFHLKEGRGGAADAAVQDAMRLLGEQGNSGQADPSDGDGDHGGS